MKSSVGRLIVGLVPWSSFWSVSVLIVERLPMLLKITESLPRKSAVSPVYNSPPNGKRRIRRGVGGGRAHVITWSQLVCRCKRAKNRPAEGLRARRT